MSESIQHSQMEEQRPSDFFSLHTERSSLLTEKGDEMEGIDIVNINTPDFNVPDVLARFGSCIECVKTVPVFSLNEIEIGDHIIFSGRIYDHHAIVSGKHSDYINVIEATNTTSGTLLALLSCWKKAEIKENRKEINFSRDKISVVYYRRKVFSKIKIAERARAYSCGPQNLKKYQYHLLENNCEHFATFCATGKEFSVQVAKFEMSIRLLYHKGFNGINNERMRNDTLYQLGYICSKCIRINSRLVSVGVKDINSAKDINVGDIVRFTYWRLVHDGVVLAIRGAGESSVKCSIAHYAFRGLLKHRQILNEEFIIPLDGSWGVVQYEGNGYNVFDDESVVQRALSRVGEERFAFFANDSFHFTRWCKLPSRKTTTPSITMSDSDVDAGYQ